jgi:hypothetical protein
VSIESNLYIPTKVQMPIGGEIARVADAAAVVVEIVPVEVVERVESGTRGVDQPGRASHVVAVQV